MAKIQTSTEERPKTSVGKIILYVLGGLTALGVLIVIGFVVIGLLVGSIFKGVSEELEDTNNNTSITTEIEDEPEEITYTEVDIKDFIQDYDDNDVTANRKYEDTYIKTTGYIYDISDDFMGNIYVMLQPSNDDWYIGTYVQCFVEDENDVNDIKSGDRITIQGQVDKFELFDISIEDCDIL